MIPKLDNIVKFQRFFMEQMMDVQLRCYDKVIQLINKGVEIQNPITIDLGEEDSERGESNHAIAQHI